MKDKKFPIVPVAIIGVAVVAGAVLSRTKPMVGSPEEIQDAKMKEALNASQQQAQNTISNGPRAQVKADDLKNEMAKTVGKSTPDRPNPSAQPLITSNVPQAPEKFKPNPSAVSGHWYTKEFGIKK